jgi:FlaG/FlaF family flagellin (archaellin)
MTGEHTAVQDDRAISPILAIVAMIAVCVALVAVLGTWMLSGASPAGAAVTADVEISYRGGDAVIHWTQEGNAERLKVVVGTESAVIEEVNEVVEVPASRDQTVVVVAESENGKSSVIARTQLSNL